MEEKPGIVKILTSWYKVSQANIQKASTFRVKGSFKCNRGMDFEGGYGR